MTGMFQSDSTTSTGSVCKTAMACTPFLAVSTRL
jgi:hypothetical protein